MFCKATISGRIEDTFPTNTDNRLLTYGLVEVEKSRVEVHDFMKIDLPIVYEGFMDTYLKLMKKTEMFNNM